MTTHPSRSRRGSYLLIKHGWSSRKSDTDTWTGARIQGANDAVVISVHKSAADAIRAAKKYGGDVDLDLTVKQASGSYRAGDDVIETLSIMRPVWSPDDYIERANRRVNKMYLAQLESARVIGVSPLLDGLGVGHGSYRVAQDSRHYAGLDEDGRLTTRWLRFLTQDAAQAALDEARSKLAH